MNLFSHFHILLGKCHCFWFEVDGSSFLCILATAFWALLRFVCCVTALDRISCSTDLFTFFVTSCFSFWLSTNLPFFDWIGASDEKLWDWWDWSHRACGSLLSYLLSVWMPCPFVSASGTALSSSPSCFLEPLLIGFICECLGSRGFIFICDSGTTEYFWQFVSRMCYFCSTELSHFIHFTLKQIAMFRNQMATCLDSSQPFKKLILL